MASLFMYFIFHVRPHGNQFIAVGASVDYQIIIDEINNFGCHDRVKRIV